jgi:hypothetical protein
VKRDEHRVVPIPDYSMPLIGWRGWKIKPTMRPKLTALLHYGTVWPAKKPIKATCRAAGTERIRHAMALRRYNEAPYPPYFSCQCGVYAVATFEHLLRHTFSALPDMLFAYGPVALWGKVIQHSRGYRAQFAYPLALFLDPPELALRDTDRAKVAKRVAASLAKQYGIPTVLMELDTKADRVVRVQSGMTPWLQTKTAPFDLFMAGPLAKRWPKRMIQQFKTAAKQYKGREAQGGVLDTIL